MKLNPMSVPYRDLVADVGKRKSDDRSRPDDKVDIWGMSAEADRAARERGCAAREDTAVPPSAGKGGRLVFVPRELKPASVGSGGSGQVGGGPGGPGRLPVRGEGLSDKVG